MCLDATIVLVMEREQRRRVEKLYPESCGRVFRITEDADLDVPDPYRRPEAAFRDALGLIDRGVSRWVQRIRRL
jgi:protein-tyrosine phosphatase